MPLASPLGLVPLLVLTHAAVAQQPVDFTREVRPLLAEHCFPCHGPDAATRKAELRLDQQDAVLGQVVVPGDPAGSELVARVFHADPEERMPPLDSGHELSEAERDVLRRWVAEGASWQEHWALVAPDPDRRPPVVEDRWVRSDIDRFVLDALRRDGREPSPAADPATLIRRVTLDLTGLPPTPAAVAAFLADDRAGAWERLVDGLLASDAYAEHQARQWLDAARYGDTHGLHLDNYREIWTYRDWVIDAFQRDLPYDRFVTEQLAGDLLPAAESPELTRAQRVATGFLRCNVSTSEGGSIAEEVRIRNVVDRTETFGTVFLGLTVGCAVCHDHKFDPITQRDFYALSAFFNSIDGPPLDQNAKDHAPAMKVPTVQQEQELAQLAAARVELGREAAGILAGIDYVEPPLPSAAEQPRQETVWVGDDLPAGAVAEGSAFSWVTSPARGARAMRREGGGLHQHLFTRADDRLRVGGDADEVLFAWVWLDPATPPRQVMLQWNDGSGWEHRAYWGEDLIDWGAVGTVSRRHVGELPETGRWVRLEVPTAAVGLAAGDVIHGLAFTQFDGAAVWDDAGIVSRLAQGRQDRVWIDDDTPAGAQRSGEQPSWSFVAGGEAGAPPAHGGQMVLRRSGGDRLNQDYFTGAAVPLVVQEGDRLFAHVWLDPQDLPRGLQLQFHGDGSWNHRVRWGVECHGSGEGPHNVRAGDVPAAGRWVRLEVDPAVVGLQPGAVIDGFAFTQVAGTVYWDSAGLATWGAVDDRHLHSLEAWIARAAGSADQPAAVREAAAASPRSAAQDQLLRDHFLRMVWQPGRELFTDVDARLAANEAERKALEGRIPTTLVWREAKEPVAAHTLIRGQYDARGEQVDRATPNWLPPFPADAPRDRLGLARWLTDPRHPLTARVAVNRLWQGLFGVGLVKTCEDFGSQGEAPSHAGLLDWLAVRFVDQGWSVKQLLREVVCSATYRQSAVAATSVFRTDPENRALARGSRYRLDAEVLRDQALALSGLLQRQIGGPPVRPPQPDGLWKAVAYVGSNTQKFVADDELAEVHRRSLYTFWKRTSPPPQMGVLDAPSRESCVLRRERTNTPLQALLLMNDPQYVECARALAQRILHEGGSSDRERAGWALRLVTARTDTEADVADVLRLVRSERQRYADQPAAAQALLEIGIAPLDATLDAAELAAWTVAANLLLNLDEVVNRS